MADILDYQAQHYLRKYIRRLHGDDYKQLKSILYCNQAVAPNVGAVYLLHDHEEHSMFYGRVTCKNPFCCPVCSSLVMEKYRERINAAIQVLKRTHFGFMVTLTMPHLGFMSWRETMDILYDAYNYFSKRQQSRGHGHALHEFHQEYPIDHNVRVCEFTWSKKNGAHPHFHAIWWIPRDKFDNDGILAFENKLDTFWLKTLKRKAIQYWQKNNLHTNLLRENETLQDLANRLFRESDQIKYVGANVAFKISTDGAGHILEAANGDYISGWGADNELTGNYRKTATYEGHMTPYQILQASFHDDLLIQVYLDYCLAVTRKPVHHRVHFSHTGIGKMIDAFLREQSLRETKSNVKKKRWEVVTYFDEDEWSQLCDLDDWVAPILANILWFGAYRRDLLSDYLKSLGIDHTRRRRPLISLEWDDRAQVVVD